jgi:hypothetical protein
LEYLPRNSPLLARFGKLSWNTGSSFQRVVSTLATPPGNPLGLMITEPPSGVGVAVARGSNVFAMLR